jgi:hypothetical protein
MVFGMLYFANPQRIVVKAEGGYCQRGFEGWRVVRD